MINQFKNEYDFLSNFYPCVVYHKGVKFFSVENAYQAAKIYDTKMIEWISRQPAKNSGLVKKKIKEYKCRKDWKKINLTIMKNLLKQKFVNTSLKKRLLDTHNDILIEGNYWHDNFFGDCYCKDCKIINGENKLGLLLMEIREEICQL